MNNQAKINQVVQNQFALQLKKASLFLLLTLLLTNLSNAKTESLTDKSDHSAMTFTYKIKGKVVSENEAMPGVNVYLKGTQTGTLTDKNGEFTFPKELKAGDILVFSFLGYESIEYTISENTPEYISISMEVKSILITGALDEKGQKKGISRLMARVKAIF